MKTVKKKTLGLKKKRSVKTRIITKIIHVTNGDGCHSIGGCHRSNGHC